MPSLRDRKKAKTHAAIQKHAFALFAQQGYDATTIEQICALAEISPSTFFRYFPTKEAVVIYDPSDSVMEDFVRQCPPEVTPTEVIRLAIRHILGTLSKEQTTLMTHRQFVILQTPALRAKMLEQLMHHINTICVVIAKRTGRKPDDLEITTFAGAVVGVSLSITNTLTHRDKPLSVTAFLRRFDKALSLLEEGFSDL